MTSTIQEALTIGLAGVVCLGLLGLTLVTRWRTGIGLVVAALAITYLGSLAVVGAPLDPYAALVAGGLLLVAELGYWSIEAGKGVEEAWEVTRRRLRVLTLIVVASIGGAGGLELITFPAQGSGGLMLLGIALALGLGAVAGLSLVTVSVARGSKTRHLHGDDEAGQGIGFEHAGTSPSPHDGDQPIRHAPGRVFAPPPPGRSRQDRHP